MSERRGVAWMLGAFAVCPCHLPLTLGALSVVLGGTAAGALLRDHIVIAGVVITAAWVLGTARGVWLLRQPKACPVATPRTGPRTAPRSPARPLEDTLRS